MPYYEVIFEDGSYSTACYDDDDEAVAASDAHHARALAGEPAYSGDPTVKVPSVRVKRLLKYDQPPGSFNEEQTLSSDEVETELPNLLSLATDANGVVHLPTLAAAVRDLSNPLVVSEPHESNYKMQETEELTGSWKSST